MTKAWKQNVAQSLECDARQACRGESKRPDRARGEKAYSFPRDAWGEAAIKRDWIHNSLLSSEEANGGRDEKQGSLNAYILENSS